MQFNLKWMLAITALVAFGCTALYNANVVWAMVVSSVTVAGLLVATVGAFHSRSFCIGMCIFGWGYLILAYIPERSGVKPQTANVILNSLYHSLPSDPNLSRSTGKATSSDEMILLVHQARQGGPNSGVFVRPMRVYFKTVGHSLFALVFGIIGGMVGAWIARE